MVTTPPPSQYTNQLSPQQAMSRISFLQPNNQLTNQRVNASKERTLSTLSLYLSLLDAGGDCSSLAVLQTAKN